MVARMSFLIDGRQSVAEEASLEAGLMLSSSHVEWLRALLRESPASFEVFVDQTERGVLRLEWQCALQGAGTGYLVLEGEPVAACLVLGGRYAAAERAAIDALQGTLQSRNIHGLKEAFDAVRRASGKPLRAVFATRKIEQETFSHVQYWTDCLAAAVLETPQAGGPSETSAAYAE
jgi:hypothetical protein